MHVYKIVHGGDVNKNVNFNCTKLFMHGFMHGYKFLNAILTEMKTEEKENYVLDPLGSKD